MRFVDAHDGGQHAFDAVRPNFRGTDAIVGLVEKLCHYSCFHHMLKRTARFGRIRAELQFREYRS